MEEDTVTDVGTLNVDTLSVRLSTRPRGVALPYTRTAVASREACVTARGKK